MLPLPFYFSVQAAERVQCRVKAELWHHDLECCADNVWSDSHWPSDRRAGQEWLIWPEGGDAASKSVSVLMGSLSCPDSCGMGSRGVLFNEYTVFVNSMIMMNQGN